MWAVKKLKTQIDPNGRNTNQIVLVTTIAKTGLFYPSQFNNTPHTCINILLNRAKGTTLLNDKNGFQFHI